MGKWEKSAWTVPVRYQGRLYGIEHQLPGHDEAIEREQLSVFLEQPGGR